MEYHLQESEDIVALKEFLLDIDCLDALSEWTEDFNLFDVLKISRTEIRHSNMLAWLLDPNENHGLGSSILRGFIQYGVGSYTNTEDVFRVLLMDFSSFAIRREWHHIDIMALSEKERFVLAIENKIDSGEHDNQLVRYAQQIDESFPDYKKLFIFLSPDGTEPSDPENWYSMGYQDVLSIIDDSYKNAKLMPEAQLMINNYTQTIRRNIVGDEQLVRICTEIYTKHQKALDLIFENRPDQVAALSEIIRAWVQKKTTESELVFSADKCNKTYTRFKTNMMSEILPDAEEANSGWKTKNHYFYEIHNMDGKEFCIQLALSSKCIPDDLRAICDKINEFYPSRSQKADWQWRIPFKTRKAKVDEEMTEEKIYNDLDQQLAQIKAFELKLKSLLSGNDE